MLGGELPGQRVKQILAITFFLLSAVCFPALHTALPLLCLENSADAEETECAKKSELSRQHKALQCRARRHSLLARTSRFPPLSFPKNFFVASSFLSYPISNLATRFPPLRC